MERLAVVVILSESTQFSVLAVMATTSRAPGAGVLEVNVGVSFDNTHVPTVVFSRRATCTTSGGNHFKSATTRNKILVPEVGQPYTSGVCISRGVLQRTIREAEMSNRKSRLTDNLEMRMTHCRI
jgi:hypothetical protein